LADVVDVVGGGFERDDFGLRLPAHPVGVKHPSVECGADDGAAGNEAFDLVVGKLAIAGDEGSAVVVAGEDGAVEVLEGLGHGLVAEVGDVEDHVQVVHDAQ
jgi:hypothetical protein